jgi:hypothetical protein
MAHSRQFAAGASGPFILYLARYASIIRRTASAEAIP